MLCSYDWSKLKRLSIKEILNFFKFVVTKDKRYLTKDVLSYYKKDRLNSSYLLNPMGLLEANATDMEKLVYIDLASRRSYSNLVLYNMKYLHIIDDIDINKLKQNTLLRIEDNKVYFKYE